LIFLVLPAMFSGRRGRRYGAGPIILWGPGDWGGGRGGWGGGSGGGFGGFSGGGGSFGGGGASGGW
ncbi:MAG: methanol dehydrogenase, partial [Alphaproteobacteria bacterium]|nr:methanol dehydrogenase [Alphaproteobacteria bacterium]